MLRALRKSLFGWLHRWVEDGVSGYWVDPDGEIGVVMRERCQRCGEVRERCG